MKIEIQELKKINLNKGDLLIVELDEKTGDEETEQVSNLFAELQLKYDADVIIQKGKTIKDIRVVSEQKKAKGEL
jgi:hypothetical protein